MTFKELRKGKFRTVGEFAQKAGIPTARVTKWETGESAPRMRDIPVVAKALGVSITTLVKSFEKE